MGLVSVPGLASLPAVETTTVQEDEVNAVDSDSTEGDADGSAHDELRIAERIRTIDQVASRRLGFAEGLIFAGFIDVSSCVSARIAWGEPRDVVFAFDGRSTDRRLQIS
jgi:hypothetical protein